jgi:hypothetical protein
MSLEDIGLENLMIVVTIILLLIFFPASRRILAGFVYGILSVLGLAFLITRDTGRRRGKGL